MKEAFKDEWNEAIKQTMLTKLFNAWIDLKARQSYQRHVDGDLLKDIFESCLKDGFQFGMTAGLTAMLELAGSVDSMDLDAKIKALQAAKDVLNKMGGGK